MVTGRSRPIPDAGGSFDLTSEAVLWQYEVLDTVPEHVFDDLTELVPAFGVIVLMAFTYNIGIGMTAGFVLYPICKLVSGRVREVRPALWGLTALSLLFFIFYPYT